MCGASRSLPCLEGESCWWQWAELPKLVETYLPPEGGNRLPSLPFACCSEVAVILAGPGMFGAGLLAPHRACCGPCRHSTEEPNSGGRWREPVGLRVRALGLGVLMPVDPAVRLDAR